MTEQKQTFKSTTRDANTAGNGKLLIVRGGNVLQKNAAGEMEPSPLAQGEDNALIGTYEGSTPNKFDDTKADQSIRTADGTLVIFNETANIRRGFASVAEGELVRVVYNGKRKMTKGKNAGKEVHDYDVQRAINAEEGAG